MPTDVIQMLIWAIFGLFITWGIFYAYVGFRSVAVEKKSRIALAASISALIIGSFWITLWVSAVVWNIIEIVGEA